MPMLGTFDPNDSFFFQGIDNISDYPVSFHYMNHREMYMMEYYVYHLRAFGIAFEEEQINLNRTSTQ